MTIADRGAVDRVLERDLMLRLGRAVLYLSMFFVPLTAIRTIAGFPLSDIGIALSATLSLLTVVRPKRAAVPLPLVVASVIGFIGTALLSLSSIDPSIELMVGVRLIFVWLLWGLAVARLLNTYKKYIYAAAAYSMGCALSGAVAICQYFGLDLRPFFMADATDSTARFIGLNGHPNGQGGALAIAVTFCLAALVYGVMRKSASVVLAVVLIGLMLSASITAFVAALLGFVLILMRARRFRIVIGGVIVGACAIALYDLLRNVFPTALTPFDRILSATGVTGESTVGQRLATIQYALDWLKEHPFAGVGFAGGGGTFDGRTQVHNMLILAYYQGGPLVLVAVLIVAIAGIGTAWRRSGTAVAESLAVGTFVGSSQSGV